MKVQGKIKMQTHPKSVVVMDIAAFKVSHSLDTDATALRAARVRSKSIGAMDELSWKVQNASAPQMRDLSIRWCWSASPCPRCEVPRPVPRPGSRESKVSLHWGHGGTVTEGSKCKHSHSATPKSRGRAQQPVSQRVSSRGQWMNFTEGSKGKHSAPKKMHILL
jgi:hypothetical protein